MVKNSALVLLAFLMAVTISFGADVYAKIDFDYEYGSNSEDVQVKVFKCQDSSCTSGKVTQISTEIYSSSAKSACFKNYNQAQMNSCMDGYKISGNKAPSSGMVVKFSNADATGNQQNYLVTASVKGDTFVTTHTRVWFSNTFTDYNYLTNDVDVEFTKVVRPRAEILQFQVKNLDNPSLPIQVNVEAGMRTTVCSAFVYDTQYHKPGFANGYSDYSAKTKITLEVVDPDTDSIIATRSKNVDIEAGHCTATHEFSWTPPAQYEREEVMFRVRTEITDDQAYEPRDDVQTKTVTVYPEDLTNACWVIADNVLIANDNPIVFNTSNLHITLGNDSYLSFDVESYKSLNQAGTNLVHNDYRVKVEFNDTEIINELVTSNAPTYYRDITHLVSSFEPGEYVVTVTVTPANNGCSIRTPVVLTDLLTIRTPPTPTPQNEAPTIQLPNDVSISDEDYTSTFTITDENVATVETVCYLNSNTNARILDYTVRTNHFRVVERLTNSAFNVVLSCRAVDEEGVVSEIDSQLISFEEINTNVAPTIDLGADVLGITSNSYTDNLYTKINDANDPKSSLTTSCTINDTTRASLTKTGNVITIEKLANQAFNVLLDCRVEDPSGLFDTDSQVIGFSRDNLAPTIRAVPQIVLGGTSQSGTTQLIATDDVEVVAIRCYSNTLLNAVVDSNNVSTITRMSNAAIDTSLTCEAEDNEGLTGTTRVRVIFDEITTPTNTAPVLTVPNLLNGSSNTQVLGGVSALDLEDGDLTNSIVCSESSTDISLTLSNGLLTVTRDVDTSIDTTVTCSVTDSGSLSDVETIRVVFTESSTPTNTAPVLTVPSLLNGSSNTQVLGGVSALDLEDGDLTNSIVCSESSTDISLTLSNGLLTVTRDVDTSIDTTVTCSVTDSGSLSDVETIRVVFTESSTPTNTAPVLTVPSLLNGSSNTQVLGGVSALDLEDGDLTNSIVCSESSTDISLTLSNGQLSVNRDVNTSIDTTVTCSVTDSGSLSDVETIRVVFTDITVTPGLPHTAELNVVPTEVFTHENVVITFNVTDNEGDVDCILTANSNILAIYSNGACVGNFTFNIAFANPGNYTISLHTEDSDGNVIVLNETVEVIEKLGPIGSLTVTPENGFAPLDVVATYEVTHPQGLNMTCQLLVNGISYANNCSGVVNLDDLAKGTYEVKLIGVDSNGLTFETSKFVTVFGEEDKLGNTTNGSVTTTPIGNGQNNVTITISNETLNDRITMIRPYIVCEDGIENTMKGGAEIGVKLHSTANNPAVNYNFVLDMTDFLFNIDYDEVCTLFVEFRDNYGTILIVNTSIVFEDTKQTLSGIPSIRGQEIDFRGHLQTLLKESVFKAGENYFGVALINNEGDNKKVTYTITGQNIFVQERGTYSLRAHETKLVPMAITLPQDVKPGVYMVRVTMEYDGIRESKLTYLKVGTESMLPTYTIENNFIGFNPVGEPSIN